MNRCGSNPRRRFLGLAAAGIASGCVHAHPWLQSGTVPAETFVFSDFHRFRQAHAVATTGDATAAMAALDRYIEAATPGLKAYLDTYGVTVDTFRQRLTTHSRYYRDVARIWPLLARNLDATRRAVRQFYRLADWVPQAPVFFFVGTLNHGATVKEITSEGGADSLGVLIPIELVAMTADTDMGEFPEGRRGRRHPDELQQLVVHELAHIAQVRLQGLDEYRAIYRHKARGTHLAYAIREGAADLLAFLGTGLLREQHRYLMRHEAEIWREFAVLRDRPVAATRGWFSGWDEKRHDRPGQLGYAVGWAMCSEYYRRHADKRAALREILAANEPGDFERIAEPYARTRG